MKIIIATSLYPPEIDDLASYSKEVADGLAKEYQVTVLTYAAKVEKPVQASLLIVNKHWPLFFRLTVFTFKLYFLARKSDLLYVQNSAAVNLPVLIIKRFLKIPVVVNFFEDETYKRAKYLGLTTKSLAEFLETDQQAVVKNIKSLQKQVLVIADKVVVKSQALADLVEKFYQVPKQKLVISYQPLLKIATLPFAVNKSDHQLLAISDLVDGSSLKELIKTLAKLKNSYPDIKLVIIGNGPARADLENLSKDLQLNKIVIFVGQVSTAENIYWLKNSQLYFQDSSQSDFANNILLSFALETLVLAQNNIWNQELISHGQNAYLFDKDDNDLAEKISKIFTDQVNNQKLVQQAKKMVQAKFSWQQHSSDLNQVFSSLKNK